MNDNIPTLFTDGGARGNPGPAGIGYVLTMPEDTEPIAKGDYIGEATNNQAEYQALIAGLTAAQEKEVKELACYLDSELIVKQLNGEYRVKDRNLKDLYQRAQEIIESYDDISFHHVPREQNSEADALVNQALDDNEE